MSNMRPPERYLREGGETIVNEADDLRAKNTQLYRLILQLITELDELEGALSVPTTTTTSESKKAGQST
jgi:hypothetical protein